MQANHFELFGLPEKHTLDSADLERRHQALKARLHPDRHVTATATERRLAEEYTANINEAHRVLLDPLARAAYLLCLRGQDPFAEGDKVKMPVDFLERQMELREELEEIAQRKDTTSARRYALSLQAEVDGEMGKLGSILDGAVPDLAQAVAASRRLRYLINCLREAQNLAGTEERRCH